MTLESTATYLRTGDHHLVLLARSTLVAQAAKTAAMVKVVDMAPIDAKLNLYVTPNAEGRHFQVAENDVTLEFGDDLRPKTFGKAVRVHATALGRADKGRFKGV
jgi:hypothetical protein